MVGFHSFLSTSRGPKCSSWLSMCGYPTEVDMAQKPPLPPDFIPVNIPFWGTLKDNRHTQRKWNTKRRVILEKFFSQNLQKSSRQASGLLSQNLTSHLTCCLVTYLKCAVRYHSGSHMERPIKLSNILVTTAWIRTPYLPSTCWLL
jgi:hypothetical protein